MNEIIAIYLSPETRGIGAQQRLANLIKLIITSAAARIDHAQRLALVTTLCNRDTLSPQEAKQRARGIALIAGLPIVKFAASDGRRR